MAAPYSSEGATGGEVREGAAESHETQLGPRPEKETQHTQKAVQTQPEKLLVEPAVRGAPPASPSLLQPRGLIRFCRIAGGCLGG